MFTWTLYPRDQIYGYQPYTEHCKHGAPKGAEGNRHSSEITRKSRIIYNFEKPWRRTRWWKNYDRIYLDFLVGVMVKLSSEGRVGGGWEVGPSVSTKNIVGLGNHTCSDPERDQCDQSIGL